MTFSPTIRKLLRDRFGSRLGREAFYSLLCGVVYAASQWLLLKLMFVYLGTATAGWYAYAMAIISPIMAFGSFGLRAILATDAKDEYSFSTYFTFRITTTLATLGCALAIYYSTVSPTELGAEMFAAFIGLGLYRSAEWFSDLAQGEYQRQGRMQVVLVTFFSKLCFGLGGFATVVIIFHRVDWGFLTMALVTLSVLLGYELRPSRLRTPLTIQFDRQDMEKIIKLALPVGVILLLSALQSSIPRYILEKNASLEALGVFAALVYLGVFGGFLSTAISNAMAPILSQYWASNQFASFSKLLLAVLIGDAVVASGMLLVFLFFGELLLRLMFNAEVASHWHYLPLVAGISLMTFWDSHLGCALAVLRRFKIQMGIQVVKMIIVTPIAFIMVGHWGIVGALFASMAFPLSSIVGFVLVILRDIRSAERDMKTGLAVSSPDSRGAISCDPRSEKGEACL